MSNTKTIAIAGAAAVAAWLLSRQVQAGQPLDMLRNDAAGPRLPSMPALPDMPTLPTLPAMPFSGAAPNSPRVGAGRGVPRPWAW